MFSGCTLRGQRVRGDYLIRRRQQEELRVTQLNESLSSSIAIQQKAAWESKKCEHEQHNDLRNEQQRVMDGLHVQVQDRRSRVADLLAHEENELNKELEDRVEDPDKRKERLRMRAFEMKQKREEQRLLVVKDKYHQHWRRSVDELRAADSKLLELEVLDARDRQQRHKECAKRRDAAEEEMFSQLWKESYAEKVKREQREDEERRERDEETKRVLDKQAAYRRMEEDRQKCKVEKERREARETMDAQAESALREEEEIKHRAYRNRREIDICILNEKERKERERIDQKLADAKMIDKIMIEEKCMREKEKEEKMLVKHANDLFLQAMHKEAAKQKQWDTQVARLEAAEQEKEWKKMEKKWKSEEQARQELLEETCADRAEQIMRKAQSARERRDEIHRERKRVDAETERMEEEEKKRASYESLLQRKHQEELCRQMDSKQLQQYRRLQQEELERKEEEEKEQQLQEALERERQKQLALQQAIQQRRVRRGGNTHTNIF
eukprot:GHVQ01013518.1.p1 GENE.GHVQ01013518.1~~GHVQ01013518.1.p1  ORF type:complete len:499 (+),score=131.92 GHVQ01013518.1:381-1877(+)